jgi:hypothetical protein
MKSFTSGRVQKSPRPQKLSGASLLRSRRHPAEASAEIEQAIEAWVAVAREDGLLVPEPRYRAPTRVGG